MTCLEVGDRLGTTSRVVQLRWLRSRGWKATDNTGARYYQRGPGHGTTGPSFSAGLWTLGAGASHVLKPWPDPPVGAEPRRVLRRVSKTNKRWNEPGRARPDEPMAEVCEAAIEGVCSGRPPTDRHHIIPRGPGSSDEAWNTLDLDAECHSYIHAHGGWARERGLLGRAS